MLSLDVVSQDSGPPPHTLDLNSALSKADVSQFLTDPLLRLHGVRAMEQIPTMHIA